MADGEWRTYRQRHIRPAAATADNAEQATVGVIVRALLNGVPVPVELDDDALGALAAALPVSPPEPPSKYLTVPEAADLMRCKRGRVDDLTSSGRLTRYRDGSRVLLLRSEVERYLAEGGR